MDYLLDDDVQLMLRFKNGEESCFVELVERHKERVFRLAYRFLGDHQEAEDLTQEVFLKIYCTKKNYTPQAKFTTWLYTVSKNTCLNTLRRKKPFIVSLNQELELEEDKLTPQLAAAVSVSPDNALLRQELLAAVKKALDSLPGPQRMAVILYRYEQLSYEEIARVMDSSVNAVKSLLHRAKLQLKEKLERYVKS